MRIRSLSGRLTAFAMIWLVIGLTLGGVVLREAFRGAIERGFQRHLETLLGDVAAGVASQTDGSLLVAPKMNDPRFTRPYSGWYWQVADQAGVIARSRSLWDVTLPQATRPEGPAHTHQDTGPRGESLLVVDRRFTFPRHDGPVFILIAADRSDIQRDLADFNRLLAMSLGILGLGLLLGVALQVRFGMGPLRALARDLDRLRLMGGRLGGTYPAEIQPLVEATNRLIDHDEALIAGARAHLSNLAHALKTPLSVIKSEQQARGGDPITAEQLRQMDRLIEYHLARARAMAASDGAIEPSRPAEICAGLVVAMEKIFRDKGLELVQDIPADATLAVNPDDMAEILGNLMENACKFARHTVRISGRAAEGGLLLAVEDDGPGLTDQQAEGIARRGARLDESQPGWGLGLAIVSDLVGLHGGGIKFGRSELSGLRVEIRFPG